MNSEKDKQKKYLETRKQLCGEEYKVRSLSPSTIKTYINALAGIYNTRRQENQFVPSSNMRFPGFNSYYAHVDKLFKVIDAISTKARLTHQSGTRVTTQNGQSST